MPRFDTIPDVDTCCGFVNDLRAAAAIIAVLGIVTSPLVSWTLLRHSYMVNVACYLTTGGKGMDVMDVNINNVIKFGFGGGSSCLKNASSLPPENSEGSKHPEKDEFQSVSEYIIGFGWAVMATDMFFVISCIYMLATIFKLPSRKAVLIVMILAFVAILFSSIYGIVHVILCKMLGQKFSIVEVFFAIFDLILWCYFIVVLNSYRRTIAGSPGVPATS